MKSRRLEGDIPRESDTDNCLFEGEGRFAGSLNPVELETPVTALPTKLTLQPVLLVTVSLEGPAGGPVRFGELKLLGSVSNCYLVFK